MAVTKVSTWRSRSIAVNGWAVDMFFTCWSMYAHHSEWFSTTPFRSKTPIIIFWVASCTNMARNLGTAVACCCCCLVLAAIALELAASASGHWSRGTGGNSINGVKPIRLCSDTKVWSCCGTIISLGFVLSCTARFVAGDTHAHGGRRVTRRPRVHPHRAQPRPAIVAAQRIATQLDPRRAPRGWTYLGDQRAMGIPRARAGATRPPGAKQIQRGLQLGARKAPGGGARRAVSHPQWGGTRNQLRPGGGGWPTDYFGDVQRGRHGRCERGLGVLLS